MLICEGPVESEDIIVAAKAEPASLVDLRAAGAFGTSRPTAAPVDPQAILRLSAAAEASSRNRE